MSDASAPGQLSRPEREAYLERIGYSGPVSSTLDALVALHHAHLQAVPFENLDIHRPGVSIRLDIDHLFAKIVERRRGGFCYELNGLFAAVLRSIGFPVQLLSARVRCAEGGFGPEFDHLVLLVELDDPWLADVGFGEGFREPLRLATDLVQRQEHGAYRLGRDGGDWFLETTLEDQTWRREYYFSLVPRRLSDFEGMCRYHSSSPESPFTSGRVCSVATSTGRVTLREKKLIITERGHRTETMLGGDAEVSALLATRFAVTLDG